MEMKIALDTNRLVDFFRGDHELEEALRRPSMLAIPYIVLAEIRAGFLCGKNALKNEKGLVRFLSSPRCTTIFPDEDTTHHYARLFQQLKKRGKPIPLDDLWIAALCVQNNLHLITRDRHFEWIEQLSSSEL